MDQTTQLIALVIAAAVGLVALLLILRRQRHDSPFAVSSEGMKRCPNCGAGNLVTDSTCVNCGKHLAG
jgi:ribosomal protein L32